MKTLTLLSSIVNIVVLMVIVSTTEDTVFKCALSGIIGFIVCLIIVNLAYGKEV